MPSRDTPTGLLRLSRVAALGAALAVAGAAHAQTPATVPSAPPPAGLPLAGEEAEEFLRSARVVDRKRVGSGITRPERMTLTDGTRTHRAIWKTIDEHRMGLRPLEGGAVEFDFRDSWRHEVAAYELDKLLGLGLVPPTASDGSPARPARSSCGSRGR